MTRPFYPEKLWNEILSDIDQLVASYKARTNF